jgi:iron complex transport system permease protein
MNIMALQPRVLYAILLPILLLVLLLALNVGPVDIDLGKGMRDRFNELITMESLILFEIRLPRSLLAMFIGATLGLAGAALQGLLRNPLAEPGIIGVSNGAAPCFRSPR